MNKVQLIGRLTKDPEVRYTNSNTAVANFTLAVNRRFKKEGQSEADFIPVVAWDKTADFCSKYFNKGLQVAVVGRLQIRSWDDNDGKKHYATEVVAEEVYFADSNKKSENHSSANTNNSNQNSGFDPLGEDNELPF